MTTSLVSLALLAAIVRNPLYTITAAVLLTLLAFEGIRFNMATGKVKEIQATRHLSKQDVFVNDRASVRVNLERINPSLRCSLEVKDVLPSGFRVAEGSPEHVVSAALGDSYEYGIEAVEMGRQLWRVTEIRLTDSLGLFWGSINLQNQSVIRVYPSFMTNGVRRLGRTRLHIPSIESKLSSRKLESEFDGIRAYYPWDDHRLIAWKTMAKSPTQNPMTKKLQELRSLDVSIMIRNVTTMGDGPPGSRKIDKTVQAVLALAELANSFGDRVSVFFYDEASVKKVAGTTLELAEELYDIPLNGPQKLQPLISFCVASSRRKSITILLMDSPYPDILEPEELKKLILAGHLSRIFLLDTAQFLQPSIPDDHWTGKAFGLLLEHEQEHLRRVVSKCLESGISTHVCSPHDLVQRLAETYRQTKRV